MSDVTDKEINESMVRAVIADAYINAVGAAEQRDMAVDDFKSVMRATLLGIFISVNECGLDHLPGPARLADLENSLHEFTRAGLKMFERDLVDMANAAASNRALRLCAEKTLTNPDEPNGIAAQGDTNGT
jgi:hypothetical protein